MILSWTCQFCRRGFQTEIANDLPDYLKRIKPGVCTDCENSYILKMRLSDKEIELCETIAHGDHWKKTLEHYGLLAQSYAKDGTSCSKRSLRKLELKTEKILASRQGTKPTAPKPAWTR